MTLTVLSLDQVVATVRCNSWRLLLRL